MTAPIIVTALLAPADFRWLDGLRRAHFPPERNQLSAHLTLFHHLPPSVGDELDRRCRAAVRAKAPGAVVDRVMLLGRGVAFGVRSAGLEAIRGELAGAFGDLLVPQDAAAWRAHVTVQNKVESKAAKALHAALSAGFEARAVGIVGLATHWYRGGPWEGIAEYRFRG